MAKKTKNASQTENAPTPKKSKISMNGDTEVELKSKSAKKVSKNKILKDNKDIETVQVQSQIEPTKSTEVTRKKNFEKPTKPFKKSTDGKNSDKSKLFNNKKPGPKGKKGAALENKPEDWNEFKKKKKELKTKRRQGKDGADVLTRAKVFTNKIMMKSLDPSERNKLVNQLHSLMKGHYSRFALAHDSSRIVQCALKYGSTIMRGEISKEIMGIVVDMMTSKYGRHIVQRMLKHGEPEIRSQVINGMYGNAVKFSSHVISSPILEYAYSTWATPLQRHHLLQEFFSDMYKKGKDNNVKHLKDVYEKSPDLKAAILSAAKENLSRIINKNLFDSGLVQTVLNQYLSECSPENRAEMITLICPHIVVISNSREGSRAAMQCIWYGTNKDRKVAMKALKEHVIELSKHEHGHCTVITFLDAADDTVLLHKILLSEILKSARDLAIDEWGRKVLLWLVAPANSLYFHPTFIKELETGREASTSKKPADIRRSELRQYASGPLLELVKNEPEFWLSKPSLAIEMLGIVKAGSGDQLQETYEGIIEAIANPEWVIKDNDQEVSGIEHAGIHMTLKKLIQHDKVRIENNETTFGACLVEKISENLIKRWIKCNRGCFLLITVFENSTEDIQAALKEKLQRYLKKLKKQTSAGAKILLNKMS